MVEARGDFPRPPKNELHTQSIHLSNLLKLVTATQDRKEINNYLYKVEVINALLPHIDAHSLIGR